MKKPYRILVLFSLIAIMFTGCYANGQTPPVAGSAEEVATLTAPTVDAEPIESVGELGNSLILLGIGLVAPILVRLGKLAVPKAPSWLLPIAAPALIELANALSHLAGGPHVNHALALLLGAAGTGLREIKDQIGQRLVNGPKMSLVLIPFLMAGALFTGCVTLNNSEQLTAYLEDARDIAEFGTKATLMENEGFRDELEKTRDALSALAALPPEKATFNDLLNALSNLPIKEIQSEKGQLYVLGGKILLRRIGRNVDVGKVGFVQPFAVAFHEGVVAGLVGTPKPKS